MLRILVAVWSPPWVEHHLVDATQRAVWFDVERPINERPDFRRAMRAMIMHACYHRRMGERQQPMASVTVIGSYPTIGANNHTLCVALSGSTRDRRCPEAVFD